MKGLITAIVLAAVVSSVPLALGQKASPTDELLRKGATALQSGNLEDASAYFQQVLKVEPSNAEAHMYLGVIADERNDLLHAEQHFAAAVTAAPGSASARNNHATALLKLGKRQQAIAEFSKSLDIDGRQPNTLLNLGQAYFGSGTTIDLRRAHDVFAKAEKLHASTASERAMLVVSIRLRDRLQATEDYRAYAEGISGAPEDMSGPQARLEIGESLLEIGLYDYAAKELRAVVLNRPNDSSVLVPLARANRLSGDLGAARELLESAVARGVRSGKIYAELAEIYEASGRVEDAIPAMRQAISADPKNEYFHLRYGLLLNDTNAPAAAVVRLEEAVKMFPSSAAMQFALGLAYYAYHRNPQAAECFEKAVQLDANFAPGYAYRGLVLADAGKYHQAIEQYDKSVALDPQVAVVHELIGEAIMRQPTADTGRAERELRRALELDSTYVPAGIELAKLLQRQGKAELAARELERIVKINPKLPQPHYLLGRAYSAMKRPEDSAREFELFQQLDKASKQDEVDARNDLLKRLANVRY